VSATCLNGHQSATSDYCDQCGARIDDPRPGPVQPTEILPDPTIVAAAAAVEPCPECRASRAGSDRYCEVCGYDFATGIAGAHATTGPANAGTAWIAEVIPDREQFDRAAPEGLDFPADTTARRVALGRPELRIGRGRALASAGPEIDIAGAHEDPAVSRLHAILVRQDDGTFAIIDQGSSNGTTINDDPTPIPVNIPVRLADGDRIHVGAWTTIVLSRSDANDAGE
jgi:hypothetical protein